MNYKLTLKQLKLKITPKRLAVLEILQNSVNPVDVEQIKDQLKRRRIKADTVTIYRIIEMYLKNDLVKKYDFHEGKFRFELATRPHHHHIVCTNCGDVSDIETRELEPAFSKIAKKSNFKITDHRLEFFGHCSICQHLH